MEVIIPSVVLAITLVLQGMFHQEKIPKCHAGEVMSGGVAEVGCNYEKACRSPEEKQRTDEWFRECSSRGGQK